MATEAQIAWAAGLFEGEGCIYLSPPSKRGQAKRLTVAMTDRDVLDRFAAIVGVGGIRPHPVRGNRKPCWAWNANRWEDVVYVLDLLMPHFGERRTAKALEILAHPPIRNGQTCAKGHPLDGVRGDGRAYCTTCNHERSRAWYLKNKDRYNARRRAARV